MANRREIIIINKTGLICIGTNKQLNAKYEPLFRFLFFLMGRHSQMICISFPDGSSCTYNFRLNSFFYVNIVNWRIKLRSIENK